MNKIIYILQRLQQLLLLLIKLEISCFLIFLLKQSILGKALRSLLNLAHMSGPWYLIECLS